MSHFKVAVITDGKRTVDELLAPYSEQGFERVPEEFMEFEDLSKEYEEEYEGGSAVMYLDPGDRLRMLGGWDEEFRVSGIGIGTDTHHVPDGWRRVEIPFKLMYPDLDTFATEWHGASGVDQKTGKYGYWSNTKAKWDWWTELDERGTWLDEYMGGNGLRICDLKFDPEFQRAKESEWWHENVDMDGEDKLLVHFHTRDMTREQFIEASGHLWFRAVVTPDGEWHEVGEMGWFGMSSESAAETYEWAIGFEDRFIRPLDPACEIHVVDCHI